MMKKFPFIVGFGIYFLVGCRGPDRSVNFGDYYMSRTTFSNLIEETSQFNDWSKNPPRYEDFVKFCKDYDKNEDNYLGYWEMKKGLEDLVTSVKR
jgi:hypothetical protein